MANPNLTAGYVFQPTGRELIDHYLVPRAGLGGDIFPGFIEEGVDILSLPPRELPFRENHIRDYGEYGTEKPYYGSEDGREAVAFRRRFTYRHTWKGGAVWSPTRWLMKEYWLNRDAAAFRRAHLDPEARDVVVVVHKVYRLPQPAGADSSSSDSKEEGCERSMVLKRKRS